MRATVRGAGTRPRDSRRSVSSRAVSTRQSSCSTALRTSRKPCGGCVASLRARRASGGGGAAESEAGRGWEIKPARRTTLRTARRGILAAGRLDDARAAAAWLARIAEESGRERVEALALLARARVAAATGEPDAVELLRGAVNAHAALGWRLDTARTRLELARMLATESPDAAVDVAKRARNELDALERPEKQMSPPL